MRSASAALKIRQGHSRVAAVVALSVMLNNGKSTETLIRVTSGYPYLSILLSSFFPSLLFSSRLSFSLCVSPLSRGTPHERQGRHTPWWPPVRGHFFSATARWVTSALHSFLSLFFLLHSSLSSLAPSLRSPVGAHSSPHTIFHVSMYLITYRLVSLRAIHGCKAQVDAQQWAC